LLLQPRPLRPKINKGTCPYMVPWIETLSFHLIDVVLTLYPRLTRLIVQKSDTLAPEAFFLSLPAIPKYAKSQTFCVVCFFVTSLYISSPCFAYVSLRFLLHASVYPYQSTQYPCPSLHTPSTGDFFLFPIIFVSSQKRRRCSSVSSVPSLFHAHFLESPLTPPTLPDAG